MNYLESWVYSICLLAEISTYSRELLLCTTLGSPNEVLIQNKEEEYNGADKFSIHSWHCQTLGYPLLTTNLEQQQVSAMRLLKNILPNLIFFYIPL